MELGQRETSTSCFCIRDQMTQNIERKVVLTPGQSRDLAQKRIEAGMVTILGYVHKDGSVRPETIDQPRRVLVVHLSTTTGNNITIIASPVATLLAYLGETEVAELNKYNLKIFPQADISSDAQGSDSWRLGWTNVVTGIWSLRPAWYGPSNYGKADDPVAGPYTQFPGYIWLPCSENVDQFYMDFPAWGAAETHRGLMRIEFWKTDMDTDAEAKSS